MKFSVFSLVFLTSLILGDVSGLRALGKKCGTEGKEDCKKVICTDKNQEKCLKSKKCVMVEGACENKPKGSCTDKDEQGCLKSRKCEMVEGVCQNKPKGSCTGKDEQGCTKNKKCEMVGSVCTSKPAIACATLTTKKECKKNKCTFEKSGVCYANELKTCSEIKEKKICNKAKLNCEWDKETDICGTIDFVLPSCVTFTTKEDCKAKENKRACGYDRAAGSCVAK